MLNMMAPRVQMSGALLLALAGLGVAQTIDPFYAGTYSFVSLGSAPGVPTLYGGLTIRAGTTDRLLIGGEANTANGALYEIGVTRDINGHINGFSGTATLFASAPYNDGGVTYGPGRRAVRLALSRELVGSVPAGQHLPGQGDRSRGPRSGGVECGGRIRALWPSWSGPREALFVERGRVL